MDVMDSIDVMDKRRFFQSIQSITSVSYLKPSLNRLVKKAGAR